MNNFEVVPALGDYRAAWLMVDDARCDVDQLMRRSCGPGVCRRRLLGYHLLIDKQNTISVAAVSPVHSARSHCKER